MIRTPTVFVLGAGASEPYGFPLGSELVEKICRSLSKDNSTLTGQLRLLEFSDELKRSFCGDLSASGRASIDAFLEKRPEYMEIGRTCIAALLLPFEDEQELSTIRESNDPRAIGLTLERAARRNRRWYHYLFDQMMTGADFEQNHLSVISFNFDRSFERAMYRAVRANYQGPEEEMVKRCASLPIVHMHGMLGEPAWLHQGGGVGRQYNGANASKETLRSCAKEIKLYVESSQDADLQLAATLLHDASVVCFLGFSYHPSNLSKLNIETLRNKERGALVGTAYGLPNGPRQATSLHFATRIELQPRDWDILTFLRESPFIHELPQRYV